jgi:hypothetical protein
MKKYLVFIMLVFSGYMASACPACEKQQPAIFRGITHGTGPDSQWDYLIISVIFLIVLITLFYSVKWLIQPGEKASDHIKHMILSQE